MLVCLCEEVGKSWLGIWMESDLNNITGTIFLLIFLVSTFSVLALFSAKNNC